MKERIDELTRQQRRYRTGLLRYLLQARLSVVLTAPLIGAGWVPFARIDLFVTVYQWICFPVYRILRVRRSDFVAFDLADLPYLNLIEKFNCLCCSCANGVAAYAREVTARTGQYGCPIKHARHERSHLPFFPEGPSPCDGRTPPPQSRLPSRGVTSPPPDASSGLGGWGIRQYATFSERPPDVPGRAPCPVPARPWRVSLTPKSSPIPGKPCLP